MRVVYPTFIAENEGTFLVFVPDMEIFTEGKDMADAIEMARDAISLKGMDMEDAGGQFPDASTPEEARDASKKYEDIFDYSKGILTYVDADISEYRRKTEKKCVRKNVTIPSWLNAEAEKANLNISRVLQDALKSVLNLE